MTLMIVFLADVKNGLKWHLRHWQTSSLETRVRIPLGSPNWPWFLNCSAGFPSVCPFPVRSRSKETHGFYQGGQKHQWMQAGSTGAAGCPALLSLLQKPFAERAELRVFAESMGPFERRAEFRMGEEVIEFRLRESTSQ